MDRSNITYYYSQKGNSYLNNIKDFDIIIYTNTSPNNFNSNILSLNVLYEAIGTKNNIQNQLLYVKAYDFGSLNEKKIKNILKLLNLQSS